MSLLLYHENSTPPAPHLARAKGEGVHPPNKPTPAVDEGTWIH